MNICRNLRSLRYFGYSCKLLSVCWTLVKKNKTKQNKEVKKKARNIQLGKS